MYKTWSHVLVVVALSAACRSNAGHHTPAPDEPKIVAGEQKVNMQAAPDLGIERAIFKSPVQRSEVVIPIENPTLERCALIEGASIEVPCQVGALTCLCTVTFTECRLVSGGCDCDYTVNPTARECH